jgi:hypothetical protein
MITDNERDELIFDFLEGNLSADEEEAFLILKDESELLSQQVRLWQNTYIKESLPSVEGLEKKLLINPKGYTGNLSTRFYTLLIMLFVYLPMTGERGREFTLRTFVSHAVNPKISLNNIVADPKADHPKKNSSSSGKMILNHEGKSGPSEILVVRNADTVFHSVVLSHLKPKPIIGPQKFTLQNIEMVGTEMQSWAAVTRKKWSKSEMRQIRKKKRLDDEKRNAGEFLKGNVPYVVPLKSNNF